MNEMKNLPFKDGYIDGITILNLEGEVLFSAKFNAKLSNPDESQRLIGKRYLDLYENLTPEMVTYGSNRQVWWLGPCGHTWKTSINHRTSKDATGCPVCAGRTRIK